ncbi:MAG: hypothetical protein K5853_02375 [Lachnospiraceae bacterium]|nr:hypothetical protein [Lachnospiraceae bacterium]
MDNYNYVMNKTTFENKLKTKEEIDKFNVDQTLAHVTETPTFLMEKFDDQMYKVRFDTKEEFQESQQILTSDEALIEYYKKKDPDMLEGLRSKSSINVVGKKAEKKKLRKKYLQSRSQQALQKALEAELIKEKRAELKKQRDYVYEDTEEEIAEQIQKEDTEEIMRFYRNRDMYEDDLQAIQKKVEGLSMTNRRQLRNIARKELLDADQLGYDNRQCQKAQEEYAKKQYPFATYEGYRIVRDRQDFFKKHQLPDDAQERLAASKYKGRKELYARTTRPYMKEVNYKIVDGKKVPKTRQDERNLAYNNAWVDSVLTEDEELIEFRCQEQQKIIEDAWNFYEKDIKAFYKGEIDYKSAKLDVVKLLEVSSKMLCLSGVDFAPKTKFFNSSYFKNLPKEKQEELDAKADLSYTFISHMRLIAFMHGADDNNAEFIKGQSKYPIEAFVAAYDQDKTEKIQKYGKYL